MPLCRLCKHEYVSLRESHIISKMFYNVIKKNSLTGFMRQTDNPNQSIQDFYAQNVKSFLVNMKKLFQILYIKIQ